MTALAADKLQEAVFAVLTADASLSAAVTAGYDEPPTDAKYPFWSLGGTDMTGVGTKSKDAVTVSFDVDVWSGEESQMQAKELLGLVDAAIKASPPASLDVQILDTVLVTAGVIRQSDETGRFYRGRITYRTQLFEKD